jgi:ligand-binding sensor domain-containing protein
MQNKISFFIRIFNLHFSLDNCAQKESNNIYWAVDGLMFLKLKAAVTFLLGILIINAFPFAQLSLAEEKTSIEPLTKFRNINVEMGLSQGTVYSVLQDKAGFIWMATQDGVNKFDGHKFTVYKKDVAASQLSNSFTTELLEDSNGDIWVGTIYGLNRYSFALDKWEHYFFEDKGQELQKAILENYLRILTVLFGRD